MCLLLEHGLRCGEIAELPTTVLNLIGGMLTFYRCEIVKAAAIRAGVEVCERVRARGPRAGEKETRSRVSPHWLRHASASHSIDRGA
jgi:hypothetical protein